MDVKVDPGGGNAASTTLLPAPIKKVLKVAPPTTVANLPTTPLTAAVNPQASLAAHILMGQTPANPAAQTASTAQLGTTPPAAQTPSTTQIGPTPDPPSTTTSSATTSSTTTTTKAPPVPAVKQGIATDTPPPNPTTWPSTPPMPPAGTPTAPWPSTPPVPPAQTPTAWAPASGPVDCSNGRCLPMQPWGTTLPPPAVPTTPTFPIPTMPSTSTSTAALTSTMFYTPVVFSVGTSAMSPGVMFAIGAGSLAFILLLIGLCFLCYKCFQCLSLCGASAPCCGSCPCCGEACSCGADAMCNCADACCPGASAMWSGDDNNNCCCCCCVPPPPIVKDHVVSGSEAVVVESCTPSDKKIIYADTGTVAVRDRYAVVSMSGPGVRGHLKNTDQGRHSASISNGFVRHGTYYSPKYIQGGAQPFVHTSRPSAALLNFPISISSQELGKTTGKYRGTEVYSLADELTVHKKTKKKRRQKTVEPIVLTTHTPVVEVSSDESDIEPVSCECTENVLSAAPPICAEKAPLYDTVASCDCRAQEPTYMASSCNCQGQLPTYTQSVCDTPAPLYNLSACSCQAAGFGSSLSGCDSQTVLSPACGGCAGGVPSYTSLLNAAHSAAIDVQGGSDTNVVDFTAK